MSRQPDWPTANCPNGHDSYGYDPDLGTPRCPECDAEEGDPVTPEDATPEVLAAWIARNRPYCMECEEKGCTGTEYVDYLEPDEREEGAEAFRWQCSYCNEYLDADGQRINVDAQRIRRELQAAQAAERGVAA